MSAQPTTGGLLRTAAVTLGCVLVACGLVWVLGGFRPAWQTGRAAPAGSDVELQRWTIAVERAEYTNTTLDADGVDPAVRVWLRITNTTKATLSYLPDKLVTVRLGGTEIEQSSASIGQVRAASAFDPDVTVRLAFDFEATLTANPPEAVTVVVRDEQDRANFVLYDNWWVGSPAALVDTPCPDHRTMQ